MPRLVRLYLLSIAVGLALALVFTALLLALDVAGLRHLVTGTRGGLIAVLMLVVFHTILFAGVQFGIRIMLMAEHDAPGGGMRRPIRARSRAECHAPAPASAPRR